MFWCSNFQQKPYGTKPIRVKHQTSMFTSSYSDIWLTFFSTPARKNSFLKVPNTVGDCWREPSALYCSLVPVMFCSYMSSFNFTQAWAKNISSCLRHTDETFMVTLQLISEQLKIKLLKGKYECDSSSTCCLRVEFTMRLWLKGTSLTWVVHCLHDCKTLLESSLILPDSLS